eukprot:scaffold78374_cov42-Prasinocladus_malaysianus.AAC.1
MVDSVVCLGGGTSCSWAFIDWVTICPLIISGTSGRHQQEGGQEGRHRRRRLETGHGRVLCSPATSRRQEARAFCAAPGRAAARAGKRHL